MKKLLFLALTLTIIACNNEPKVDYVVISGNILNKPSGELIIDNFDQTLKKTIKINNSGAFSDTLRSNTKKYVLYDGKNPIFLYLEPGYNLKINYSASDFENTLSITGKGSEVSNYLYLKRKHERKIFGNAQGVYSLDESSFKEKLKSMNNSYDSILSNAKNIPSDFAEKEKRNLQYSYLNHLSDYENAYRYFTKNQNFKVSDSFLDELNEVDFLNEADYDFSHYYKRLVANHYRQKISKIKNDTVSEDIQYLNSVGAIKAENIKNGLLFEHANYSMARSKDVKLFYEAFLANSTNEENNKIIIEKYKKSAALLKGSPSPSFVNYENYKGGTSSLTDFKGKYVYIDVWATWCGPCVREIPSLKKVEAEFHNKNIEFVSVSIDKNNDHEKWINMIKERELRGVQLFADNDWNSDFVKDYQIQGIPRFILIDPNGNIVNSNAPRPSSPKLIELFNSLNI